MVPRRIALTFQGGFVGTRCSVDVRVTSQSMEWRTMTHIYPEDINRRQSFELKGEEEVQNLVESGVESLKLVFEQSSDFFGRITIYDLKVEGLVI